MDFIFLGFGEKIVIIILWEVYFLLFLILIFFFALFFSFSTFLALFFLGGPGIFFQFFF